MTVYATKDGFILRALKDGNYRVDENGSVWDCKTEARVKVSKKSSGHLTCWIRVDGVGKRICVHVHRIVALATHGRVAPNLEVDHINGIKDDNRPENLELVPRSVNLARSYALGSRRKQKQDGSKNNFAKLTEADVLNIREQWRGRKKSQNAIARDYGISQSAVSLIVRGINWKHLA